MNVFHKSKCFARGRRGFSKFPSIVAGFLAREMAPSIDFLKRKWMDWRSARGVCFMEILRGFSMSLASLNNLMLVPTSLASHRIGIGALAPTYRQNDHYLRTAVA